MVCKEILVGGMNHVMLSMLFSMPLLSYTSLVAKLRQSRKHSHNDMLMCALMFNMKEQLVKLSHRDAV